MVGNEGFVGVELLLGGGSTPSRAIVRTAGEVLGLPAETLRDEIARGPLATHLLLRYTMTLIDQVAQTAVCNRHHSLDQRHCRWLLMSLDRTQGNEVVATQGLIANMLGVRREGVTEVAFAMQRLGLIHYVRGRILVLDRRGLERRTCECYAVVEREYHRLLPGRVATPVPQWSTVGPWNQTTVPNNLPTPAVIAMARAPQKKTRHAPAKTLAPPALAATPPNKARNARDIPAVHGITCVAGAAAATAIGSSAPAAKLAHEAKAA
ncbi:Crp-like helix-turn-helix protein [Roseateles toxinivorans]|uniref:Crp-like helix-turn-helix protein n=1 Tax=Roseateles toxinivorans TaxID=270368 RepID=A0A4R6QU74_9BURK|nr:Crp-like helix-turn-helix protein [Roseateles toxinivorans]